jgi:hypothetical protein
MRTRTQSSPDIARCVITDVLEPGQRPRLFKIVSYAWSEQRTIPALRESVAAAATAARQAGWDGLLQEPARVPRRLLGPRRRRDDPELHGMSCCIPSGRSSYATGSLRQLTSGAVIVEEVHLDATCMWPLHETEVHVPVVWADQIRIFVAGVHTLP